MHTAIIFGFAIVALVAGNGVRVEYKLTQLHNPQGILSTRKKCDVGSKCDPKLTGYVDTDSPLATWPGPKTKKDWTKIFEASDEDSPKINKIVSRDCCSRDCYRKANLRIDAVDADVTTSDQMEQFECLSGRDVAASESQARWSTEKPCDAKFNPKDVKLNYSWRAFTIPDRECGRPVGSAKKA
ncbi:uncharacterized protein LOC129587506 [Paramacrobiotus metropolitanus]|uniref:uncharacterized protein LOC129587506 n=1 Tax=Paramacrobiotus metropolitanus TaxID=2943436 RepID=UPI002445B25A|nr:uncharacterized protein LOC129587506 [Paramacrobiotus metropolitanus]